MQAYKKLCDLFSAFIKKREPAPPPKSKLEQLADQTEFFVYDGRKNYWGHSFEVLSQAADQKLGDQMLTAYRVYGFRDRSRPQEGDRVALKLQSGKTGLYLLTNIDYKRDPADMFGATAVGIDGDYKGGFGWNGQQTIEPQNRVKPAAASQPKAVA